jgi:predicted Zn-dependent peptidase
LSTLYTPGPAGVDGHVRLSTLASGVRVVTEAVPGTRSASVGFWVAVGSVHESPSLAGATHFLEHLLFKGTPTRGPLQIAEAFDAVGGEANAFTAQEHTCYYAHVLDTDLPMAVQVLGDMLCSSLLLPADVRSERQVVLEEIAMLDDEPADLVHDAFSVALFGDGPLGRPIIGSAQSLGAMTRARVAGWYASRYRAPQVVVSAAGAVDHSCLVRLVRTALAPLPREEPAAVRTGPGGVGERIVVRHRPTEQVHVVLGVQGLRRGDPGRHAQSVLVTALGGGMSSRLFQEIREKRGLVYTVAASTSAFTETGVLDVYAGCTGEKLPEVLDVATDVIASVAQDGLGEDEVARAIGQVRGSFVLSLEDPTVRMERLGRQVLHTGTVESGESVLAALGAVDVDRVDALAADLLSRPWHAAAVGASDVVSHLQLAAAVGA